MLYTFPFEGNWNHCRHSLGRWFQGLLYTFPFEGNWNCRHLLPPGDIALYSLAIHFPVWRELKHYPLVALTVLLLSLAIHFPVWRELKPHLVSERWCVRWLLLYTFPFEGNWNLTHCGVSFRTHCLLYTFPFEGNWNKTIHALSQHNLFYLAIHFPVWRELKHFQGVFVPNGQTVHLLYTFPFEGNWNSIISCLQSPPSKTCYTLSRLKGIETFGACGRGWFRRSVACYTLSRLKGIETKFAYNLLAHIHLLYTFPFEGNWNFSAGSIAEVMDFSCYTLSRLKGIETGKPLERPYRRRVTTCYTLSRLKGIETLLASASIINIKILAIHFPVWRELKP